MNHIRPRWIDDADFNGELSPSDYGVFIDIPDLAHVARFWDALVTQALAVDEASAKLAMPAKVSHTGDPEHAAWIQERLATATDAHFYLTRASLLSLMAGFVEFSLLEAYKTVFGSYPSMEKPKIGNDVIKPLKSKIGDLKLPDLYVDTVIISRDTIRNALQHGRCMGLREASDRVDIHDAFLGVVSFAYEIETALRNAGKIE